MEQCHDVNVRRAAESDLDAVARVWHEGAASMVPPPAPMPSLEALRERIDAELQSGWQLHVAMCGGATVGMLALKPEEAMLDQIFVAPGARRQGVGAALLDVAKRAMPAGFGLRMAASNVLARQFYEKEGLRRTGDGIHPWTREPVLFYAWHPGPGR